MAATGSSSVAPAWLVGPLRLASSSPASTTALARAIGPLPLVLALARRDRLGLVVFWRRVLGLCSRLIQLIGLLCRGLLGRRAG